jgi:hypothetical protein
MEIEEMEIVEDPDFGKYLLITVDSDALEALELNLKLLDAFDLPILVSWKGRIDPPADKIADLVAEVLMKSEIRPILEEGYSAVKAIEEEREDR